MSEKKDLTNQQGKQPSQSSNQKSNTNNKVPNKSASEQINSSLNIDAKDDKNSSKSTADNAQSSTAKAVTNDTSKATEKSATTMNINSQSKKIEQAAKSNSAQVDTKPNTSSMQINSNLNANKDNNVTNNGKTPPSKSNNNGNSTSSNGGSGLSMIAIVIALASAGMSAYTLMNNDRGNDTEALTSLQQRLDALESNNKDNQINTNLTTLNEQISALENKFGELDAQKSLSEEDINKLIDQQLSSQSEQTVSPEQIKQYIDSELANFSKDFSANAGLSAQEVQAQIKLALASFSQDAGDTPKFDFSEEIAKIEQSEQNVQKSVQQIDQRANEIKQTLDQQAQSIQSQISQANQRANPYPILNLLRLANAMANLGDAAPSALYLEQAAAEFDTFNLNQEPYASFKTDIEEKAKDYRALADSANNPVQQIDGIIANLNEWPFKQANVSSTNESDEQTSEDKSFMASIKSIGTSILNSTVTVTKNDEEGLSWINENAQLQQLIRQNVRLDLAFARNALSYHDNESFKETAERLQTYISRYFDESDANVSQALDTLANIDPQQADMPNLSDLIEQFAKAATKE